MGLGWDEYVEAIKDRFGPSYEALIEDLMSLRHQDLLAEFNDRLDAVSYKLKLPKEYLVHAYIAGLRKEFVGPVHLFNPMIMKEARSLARVQEINMQKAREKRTTLKSVGSVVTGASTGLLGGQDRWRNYKGALLNSGTQPLVKTETTNQKMTNLAIKPKRAATILSLEEVEEHRLKNLRFYCHGSFTKDHSCPQRKRMQLQLIELESEGSEYSDKSIDVDARERASTPQISLLAIEGIEGATSIRVQGILGQCVVQILIDCGSTYDFLDLEMAKKLRWCGDAADLGVVEVAGSDKKKVYRM